MICSNNTLNSDCYYQIKSRCYFIPDIFCFYVLANLEKAKMMLPNGNVPLHLCGSKIKIGVKKIYYVDFTTN